MALTTAAVLVITSVGLAGARSSSPAKPRWLARTKITTLTVAPTSTTALTAKWDPMYWAASYDLKYSGTNVPNPVLIRGIKLPSQVVGSLVPRGTYSVRVRSVMKSVVSQWSGAIQVTLPGSDSTTPMPTTPTP